MESSVPGLMRVARVLAVGCLLAVATLLSVRPAGAQTAERIHLYDVQVRIDGDGSIAVVETIDYDFGASERHGIFRDIPVRFEYDDRYDRVYPVDVLSVVGSAGTPDRFVTEREGSVLRIRIGDPDVTISGRHTYTITYRVEGTLNGFPAHDELYWNAIGTFWDVPIDRATVVVSAPADILQIACFTGPEGSDLPCAAHQTEGSTATFGQDSLRSFEGLSVVAAIPKGVVPDPMPILEERWSLGRAFSLTPVSIALTGAVLVVAVLGLGWLLWVTGRDRRVMGSPVDIAFGTGTEGEQSVPLFEHGSTPVEYAPPDGIRPGQLGTLVDERANPLDVTATLVDLAVRGFLRIEEIPKRGWFGKPDWRLAKLTEPDGSLQPYERKLFDGLFEDADQGGDGPEDDDAEEPIPAPPAPGHAPRPPALATVRLSALRRQFSERLGKVQDALYDDAVRRGWFAARPDKIRGTWALRGWLLFAGGSALVGLAAWRTELGLVPIPVALAGLVMAVGSRWMPRRTPRGTGMVRRVLGFRTYIDTAEKEEARFAERANLFSQYLPYAIVFGLTEKWARAFAGLGEQAFPAYGYWYVGSGPFTVDRFASSIDGFAVSTAGTIASTPAGSGSSGFGGGGFSGGGGGGGGGGSW